MDFVSTLSSNSLERILCQSKVGQNPKIINALALLCACFEGLWLETRRRGRSPYVNRFGRRPGSKVRNGHTTARHYGDVIPAMVEHESSATCLISQQR